MKNTGFLHIRTIAHIYDFDLCSRVGHHGGVTVAYEFDEETKKLRLGFAVCSKKDLFNKSTGRIFSFMRLSEEEFSDSKWNAECYLIGSTKTLRLEDIFNSAIDNLPPQGKSLILRGWVKVCA